jgi:hypothetical protein
MKMYQCIDFPLLPDFWSSLVNVSNTFQLNHTHCLLALPF